MLEYKLNTRACNITRTMTAKSGGNRITMEPARDTPEKKPAPSNHSVEARLAALSKLGHRLCAARTQREAIKIILEIADNFFGWDACTFDSYSAADDLVHAVIVIDRIGDQRVDVEPVVRHARPTRRMRQVIDKGQVLILRKPPFQMPPDAVPMGDQSRASASLMHVPIRMPGQVIGLLSIQSYTPNAYTLDDLELLQALADHGAGALERIQAGEKIVALNRELEDRITERTAELAATIGELEAFSYSVSHDLRAPLRAMHGYAQLLLENYPGKVLDEIGVERLSRIARSAVRLDLLIQDVLAYSKVLRGQITLEPLDLNTLLQDTIAANPQWQPPAAQIQVTAPLPRAVANEALLMQCLSNLIGNAIKFVARDTEPIVQIRPEITDGNLRIWIEDNGIGIAKEDETRIFRMFERVHPNTQYEGTGMGLTIARKAAERMNGRIGLESTPGRGSKFWIQLPLA